MTTTDLAASLPTGNGTGETDAFDRNAGPSAKAHETTAAQFDEIVEEYFQKIYNVVYRYLGDADEASDVTQEVFLRAYQSFAHFRGESQVYTWLYRIALNLCHNRVKQLRRRYRVEQESLDAPLNLADDQIQREVADWTHSPTRLAEGSELNRLLQQSIRRLSPEHRAVIVLRDIQGLSYAEIAEITDSSVEAVKSRLFRARTQLKTMLQPYLEDTLT